MHPLPHQHQHQHDQRQLDEHPHYHLPHDQLQQPMQPQQPHYQHQHHQQQRKPHSHSPYHSRHTSPHSHHSHSLHSSPHQSQPHVHECTSSDMRRSSVDSTARNHHQHAINQNPISSHSSHHHHVHRRRKRQSNNNQHSNGTQSGTSSGTHMAHGNHERSSSRPTPHGSSCSRRHRSATDVSSTSINTCHEPLCADREVQEILVRKSCCSSSRTELAQYFAEDLYGSSRRPSSCCTSSDYCYHTDSTSLYGSRSSLSRNNSIKSASVAMRKKRLHQRQPSYTSISLRGLNASRPNSQLGSLTSIFDRAKQIAESSRVVDVGASKVIVSPSKVTIERQTSSKEALNQELPDYACSPSPIRWSFLADGKSPTEFEGAVGGGTLDGIERHAEHKRERAFQREGEHEREHLRHDVAHAGEPHAPIHSKRKYSYDERPSTSSGMRKMRDSPFSCDFEQSTTVLFHQEGEAFNNCCSNYIQCNTYLDQDLQITSEDIHQYLSKGNQQIGDILNNSKNYPFQPSNALEFQYKNNFANNNSATPSETGDSMRGGFDGRFRRNSSKETNLNQQTAGETGGCSVSSCASTPLSPTNINLSSSTNNINIVFNSYAESNANEVKFINTTRENTVSAEAHHTGYLPYTYPSYDYTNMSANSLFDKPIGIDAIPNNADGTASSSATGTDGQHSSSLQSPVPHVFGVDDYGYYDSFDAASENNLLSQRSSCQFSPATPRSPLSPGSPATTSSISASINPAYHQRYYHYGSGRHQQHPTAHSPSTTAHNHDPYRHTHHHHHHFTEGFKFSNAFKRVRKRARKYADFLRKK